MCYINILEFALSMKIEYMIQVYGYMSLFIQMCFTIYTCNYQN